MQRLIALFAVLLVVAACQVAPKAPSELLDDAEFEAWLAEARAELGAIEPLSLDPHEEWCEVYWYSRTIFVTPREETGFVLNTLTGEVRGVGIVTTRKPWSSWLNAQYGGLSGSWMLGRLGDECRGYGGEDVYASLAHSFSQNPYIRVAFYAWNGIYTWGVGPYSPAPWAWLGTLEWHVPATEARLLWLAD